MWKRTACKVVGCSLGSKVALNLFADKTFLDSPDRTAAIASAGRFSARPLHLAVDCETRKPKGLINSLQVVRESPGAAPYVEWDSIGIPVVVTVIQEDHGPQKEDKFHERLHVNRAADDRKKTRRYLHGLKEGATYRVEVLAKGWWYREEEVVRFVVEKYQQPCLDKAARNWESFVASLQPFLDEHGRPLKVLVLGKQHHGKSSFVNHMNRWLRQDMSQPDVAKAAPPGEMETTLRIQRIEIPFQDMKSEDEMQHSLILFDVPAFQTMNEERKNDLRTLQQRTPECWGRGESVTFLHAAEKPDCAVVVVSLINWQDEHDSLKVYLQRLQQELRVPFVVVATHKDKFILGQGNNGLNPQEELKAAIKDLQEMANTNQVFAISNYHADSWWIPSVDDEVVKLLRQLLRSSTKGTAK